MRRTCQLFRWNGRRLAPSLPARLSSVGGLQIERGSVMTEPTTATQVSSADERARAVEEQMTDEERFSLIISVIGATRLTARDRRIPEGVAMSAGYTPGVPRSEERRVGKECRSRWSPYH